MAVILRRVKKLNAFANICIFLLHNYLEETQKKESIQVPALKLDTYLKFCRYTFEVVITKQNKKCRSKKNIQTSLS